MVAIISAVFVLLLLWFVASLQRAFGSSGEGVTALAVHSPAFVHRTVIK